MERTKLLAWMMLGSGHEAPKGGPKRTVRYVEEAGGTRLRVAQHSKGE